VIRLVASGMKNREIAQRLVISEGTVVRHVANIFAKLGVNNRTAAARAAAEHGLL
jgi:DNA-binding NarL/FixJ family response regulator